MENNKNIQIFRYGKPVAEVTNKEYLRQWIIDNCPYNENREFSIPPTTSLTECMVIAKHRGYTFTHTDANSAPFEGVSRFGNIMAEMDIAEVAADLGYTPTKKGKNFICKCPHCKSEGMVALVPSKGVYRCFVCGETGNSVSFVKAVRRLGTDDAVNYLESMYINK